MLTSAVGHLLMGNSSAYVSTTIGSRSIEKTVLLTSASSHMFRGNSDACVSATVESITIKKTVLLTSFHFIVFNGNRSAYRKSKSTKKSSSADDTPVKVISEISGSKKRVATEDNAPDIPKKRHTVKTKPSPSQESLDIVNVAQDVVPIQIAADILSLSTQVGDIADYIRSGDAKKGEIGSSSRRPPPVHVERRPLPTPTHQGASSSGHGRALSVEEAAEMVREADRQADRREREMERERRLRRRGH
ncbi:hypothetical protein F511_43410 [Dorcoceras hygrometricum]|uniref:Uncharacterized protein n=1 Tax=Dorcoceras hygrometricum TaxID=472368 RepID=A0A2Z7BGF7_9LAMI|nr:hypothetical protein F511_43410 [Dorcoceras hygrometricum]